MVHLQRMKDGKRRIVSITEVVGIEQDTVLAQDVATFELREELDDGTIRGEYVLSQFHPQFISKMRLSQASPEEAELIRQFSEPRQTSR